MKVLSFLSVLLPFAFNSVNAVPLEKRTTWTATPFNPPAVPLAVRTPYLSAWLQQGAGTALNEAWPTFWNGDTLGWAGYVKVDGNPFTFMGNPGVPGTSSVLATQTALSFTSTQSTFTMTAGPVDLTINFLSPVIPSDLLRQSLPFAYMTVEAKSNDGHAHHVQVYSDISGEWCSGNSGLTATWSTDPTSNGLITHQVQLQTQQLYTEVNDHIQQGAAYYAVANGEGVTWQSGQDVVLRAQFINNGVLKNTQDTNFRAINNDWPVFAISKDLGNVTSTSEPVVYVVGHVRDPAVQYIVDNGILSNRSSFFFTQLSTPEAAVAFFEKDYSNALSAANALDKKIQSDAETISSDYADLVALSVRQAYGATELTVGLNESGGLNSSDILVFLKEISSDGNVNTVDVIMPAWPAYVYIEPLYGRYLLEGLFRYQASGQYPNKWSVHDLGASYPKADGHNDGKDEAMPVEECGNMLIMTLSYTQASGDTFLIDTYFDLLNQWTQFLTNDSLIPQNQLSTDDFAGTLANQTNLALKGTIGINAMSVIAGKLGMHTLQSNYSSIAASYAPQIVDFALSSDGKHLELNYGAQSSWGLSYNLYGDKLLGTHVFNETILNIQTAWYPTVALDFGVPLDTRHTYTKSDWQIWTSTLMTNTQTRDLFINSVRNYAANGQNNAPLSDWYDATNGVDEGFRARPVVGGHLAHLALLSV